MTTRLLYRYIVLFFVIIETFSILQGYVLIREWIFIGIMIGISFALYPKSFINKTTLFLFLYSCILIIFSISGHSIASFKWTIIEVTGPLVCLCIYNGFEFNDDKKGLKIVTIAGLIIIIVSSILTIPIAIRDPMSVRKMVIFSFNNDLNSLMFYQRMGMVSFGLVHAFPFLIPILIYHLRVEKKLLFKIFYVFSIVIPFYMIVKASFATSIIIATIGLIISILLSNNKKWNFVLILLLFTSIFIFTKNELITIILETLQPAFEGTPVEEKITELSTAIKYDEYEGDLGARTALYQTSWDTFFKHPLLGSMDKSEAGGHAYFVDRLAYFGLFGIVPFFLFYYSFFKKNYFLIETSLRKYYLVSIALFITLGFTKNISGIENFLYLFILIPGLCLSIHSNESIN